jgi:hypothetical protein
MRANGAAGVLFLPMAFSISVLACRSPEVTATGDQGAGGAGGIGASGGGGTGGAGGTGPMGCADALIALDRSCSMNNMPKGFTRSKYAVAEEVLKALTGQYQSKMAFGLNAFPPLPSEGTRCDAGRVYAGIALGAAAPIASAIAALDPSVPANQNCGTPTAANLERLAGYPPLLASGHQHNIILLTDGMPACAGETVPRSVAAIQNLRSLGVRTFVIGFLAGANQRALDMMAEAGGEPQPPPAATRYFNAADPEQLNFSLRKILSNICGDIPTPGCPAGSRPVAPVPPVPRAPTAPAGAASPSFSRALPLSAGSSSFRKEVSTWRDGNQLRRSGTGAGQASRCAAP